MSVSCSGSFTQPPTRKRGCAPRRGVRPVSGLRLGDLDCLSWAGRLARHAEDAIGFPYWIALVASELLVLRAAGLQDFVLPRPRLPGIEQPFKDENRANVHANAIGSAGLPVDGNCGPMNSIRSGIWLSVPVHPLRSGCSDLVAVVFARDWVFICLLQEIRIDRARLVAYLTSHSIYQGRATRAPI